MTTLADFRNRTETILADTGNEIWNVAAIDEAIRQALHEYSRVRPRNAIDTIALSADGRELDIASLTDLLAVYAVWLPYTASDPEFPPNIRNFEHWVDQATLYFPDGAEPQASDVARVFYTALHTIQSLDGATSTTVPGDHETLIAQGAAGYAATSRAVDAAARRPLGGEGAVNPATAQQIRAWGLSRLHDFRAGLTRLARALARQSSAHVPLPPLDRWQGRWS